jgi:hypothetical protein
MIILLESIDFTGRINGLYWGTLKIYERLGLQPTKIALFNVIFKLCLYDLYLTNKHCEINQQQSGI